MNLAVRGALGFLIGVALWYAHSWWFVVLLVAIFGWLFLHQKYLFEKKAHVAIFLLGVTMGITRGVWYEHRNMFQLPQNIFNQVIEIEGVVQDDPDRGESKTVFTIIPKRMGTLWISGTIPDRILVRANGDAQVSYHDYVMISGLLEQPEIFTTDTNREFNYPQYLSLKNISGIIRANELSIIDAHDWSLRGILYDWKNNLVQGMRRDYSGEQAGLLAGVSLGVKSLFPKETTNAFQIAGLTHIMVLSGYNITLVATLATYVFARISWGYRSRRIGGMIIAILFVVMTGLNASAVRAGIMTCLAFLLQITCRPQHAFSGIVYTLMGMSFLNPRILTWDPSLHLSFLAFVGLVYSAPLMLEKMQNLPSLLGVRDIFAETLGVQIIVLPYIVWMSGRFSLFSLLANVVVAPIVPMVMAGGLLSVGAGFVTKGLARFLAEPVSWGLESIIWVAKAVASIDKATITLPVFSVGVLVGVYLVIMIYLIRLHNR